MIEALNSLEVTDWSAFLGELEYVLAEATKENINTLLEAGFTQKMIDEARGFDDKNDIDLTYLAVNFADVYCWHKDIGFCEEDELEAAMRKAGAST